MRSLINLIKNKKEKSPFSTSKLSHVHGNAVSFNSNYEAGSLLTTQNIDIDKSVITVEDDKGNIHILGENYK